MVASDLNLALAHAEAQLAFVRHVALGMMAPVPYATRIAQAMLVLAMGFVTGERDRFTIANEEKKEEQQASLNNLLPPAVPRAANWTHKPIR